MKDKKTLKNIIRFLQYLNNQNENGWIIAIPYQNLYAYILDTNSIENDNIRKVGDFCIDNKIVTPPSENSIKNYIIVDYHKVIIHLRKMKIDFLENF